ncbi:spondin domain-containing protein [Roseibacillus persicicus]|uniref:spondin domain-containing protein n=1 Tax=Roseibacillus persicicus TaxID=454148 RepID=UPI00398A63D1
MKTSKLHPIAFAGIISISSSATAATSIRVSIQTTGPVGIAPGIAGFSNGSFDIFDPGSAASAALENLAETGSPAGFMPSSGGAVLGPGVGPGSPPIFAPGASGSAVFEVADGDNMFHFASMLLPSNDWFIGNGDGFDVSSLLGASNGSSLFFDFTTVWDAGTELEDFDFSPGNPLIGIMNPGGGAADFGTDQGGVVTALSDSDPFGAFANADLGFDSTQFDFTGEPIARVTLEVIPEPSTSLLAGLSILLGLSRRRRH